MLVEVRKKHEHYHCNCRPTGCHRGQQWYTEIYMEKKALYVSIETLVYTCTITTPARWTMISSLKADSNGDESSQNESNRFHHFERPWIVFLKVTNVVPSSPIYRHGSGCISSI